MPNGRLRKVAGLWQHGKTDGSGELYFSGRLRNGVKIYAYKNRYKRQGRQDPDYYLWIERDGELPEEKVDRKVKPPPRMEESGQFSDGSPVPPEEEAPPERSDYGDDEVPF